MNPRLQFVANPELTGLENVMLPLNIAHEREVLESVLTGLPAEPDVRGRA